MLAWIRKENTRAEKISPYNFCDRWCEKCPGGKRKTCRVYGEEFDRTIRHIAKGENPEDRDVVLEDVRENLEKSFKLLAACAEKEKIDISKCPQAGDTKRRESAKRKVLKHPLYKTALRYSRESAEFIKAVSPEIQKVNAGLEEDFETLLWYHVLIPVKARRMLSGLLEEDKDDFCLFDVVAQLEIVKKSLAQSIAALQKISCSMPRSREDAACLIDLLLDIGVGLGKIEASV